MRRDLRKEKKEAREEGRYISLSHVPDQSIISLFLTLSGVVPAYSDWLLQALICRFF
jgi:hypothetical protein